MSCTLASNDPVSSPAFHEWFEGSKVVDKAGSPLVVYHGTPHGDFEEFDISMADRDAFRSIWFSECEGQALLYALGQKEQPYSILPVLPHLRAQQPALEAELNVLEEGVRITTHPDGTAWESFDHRWLCDNSRLFDYQAALRLAFPEPRGPRIHCAYLRAVNPYIGADEQIARRLWQSKCVFDSYLSIMAPYAEWAVPSVEQIWMVDSASPRPRFTQGLTFGMAHTAAGLGAQWCYDSAAQRASRA